jgi:hypothetical protein
MLKTPRPSPPARAVEIRAALRVRDQAYPWTMAAAVAAERFSVAAPARRCHETTKR